MSEPHDTKNPPKSYAQAASEGAGSSENPPPPYTPQHGQAGAPSAPQAHRQQAPQRPLQQQQHQPARSQQQPLLRSYQATEPSSSSVVVVVPHHAIAVARARRRFFGALFWAFIIYLVVGVLFGDWELERGRSRHKHRNRHRDHDRDWDPDWDYGDRYAVDVERVGVASAAGAARVPVLEQQVIESATESTSNPTTVHIPTLSAVEDQDTPAAAVDFLPEFV